MKLYKLKTQVGEFLVVANHPTEAEQKLMKVLNDTDYGYSRQREVTNIEVMGIEITDKFITGKNLIL